MNIIEVKANTSYATRAMVQMLAETPGLEFVEAKLNTRTQPLSEDSNSEDWPLIVKATSKDSECRNLEIRVYNLTSGYPGSGPSDLIRCLKAMDFIVDEEEIYSCDRIQRVIER